jgi:hypothetical protein
MCIACELELWLALDQLPAGAVDAPKEPDARFACDAPDAELPQPVPDEHKP